MLEDAGVLHLRCDACGCAWNEPARLRNVGARIPKRASLSPPPIQEASDIASDQRCPQCRHKGARIMLEAATAIYLRCESCGSVWQDREGRARKRLAPDKLSKSR